MHMKSLTALALAAPAPASVLIRFGCSQLVVERLDPLVTPGSNPSPHLHQIIGGNAFNATMDPESGDIAERAMCTTCQFSEDFSNHWTAVLFLRARNGSYQRVPQIPNVGRGSRMLIGDASYRTKEQANRFRQITYACLQDLSTRFPETMDFPKEPCPAGIMANVRFPTCWDGKNLDSPDHMSHMSYPETGTFESGGPCPASHPVRVPQLMYETIWDTSQFNSKDLWPEDGSQPFVWSMDDTTGFGSHGDYVFGWKGDALQRAMDSPCYVKCPTLKTQSIDEMNKCSVPNVVDEVIDGWLESLPGYPSHEKKA
ncbi:uncharacterized protein P884DRAFT_288391 [Thermothelomyces heterothallicus CBS 202.75]|uniref:uncharacterized protein n=1 Tax=Thermothelomyces heterothallicus CBS 202.75 TaxID=1149848 RepID=UPI0037434937